MKESVFLLYLQKKTINQTDMEKEKLRSAIEDILWMAIRYADGRHTYAPSTVRGAVKTFKEVYPDFEVKKDHVIQPPRAEDLGGMAFKEDYLYDLVNQSKTHE